MTFTRWTGRPKTATKGKTGLGISTLNPTELNHKLTEAGWTHIELTVNGRTVQP